MPEQTEVKKDEVDERGVPVINKVRELERKLSERDQEFEELRRWKQNYESEAAQDQVRKPSPQEKLAHFVADPDAWLEERIRQKDEERRQQQVQTELTQVRPWLHKQSGYDPEKDNSKLMEIENRYALGHNSPLQRAQAAWDILQKERAYERLNSMTDDERREARVGQSATEGTGKATSKEKVVTRVDVIRKLAEAEAKGDLDAAIKYTSLLEDIR